MALPSSEKLKALNYSLDGTPFFRVVLGNLNPNGLQMSIDGTPWWGHANSGVPPQIRHIKAINRVVREHIKKYNGVSETNINKALNVEG